MHARQVLYNQTLLLLFYITVSHNLKQLIDIVLLLTTFKNSCLIELYKLQNAPVRSTQPGKYPGEAGSPHIVAVNTPVESPLGSRDKSFCN